MGVNDTISALIIRDPWIDMIFNKENPKDWEIRGCATKKRGHILIARSTSKTIVGEVDIVDCIELDTVDFLYNAKHHKIPKEIHYNQLPYDRTYAWVFRNAVKYKTPISYVHPQGPVIWVNLPADSLNGIGVQGK